MNGFFLAEASDGGFMKSIAIASILSALLSAHVAKAQTSAPAEAISQEQKSEISPTATHLICKNKDSVRTIRIDKNEAGGCETIYTKSGKDSQEAESSSMPKCLKVLHSIRANLEKADWKCRDISQSRVSSSEAP
jgi:hypothetical protein